MRGVRVAFTYQTPLRLESFPFDVEGPTRADLVQLYAERYARFGEVKIEETQGSTRVAAGDPGSVFACVVLSDVTLHRHPTKGENHD